jgi:hypothetical protein
MDKITRPFEPSDYHEMVKWYSQWGVLPPPIDMLPKNGYVVPMVCAGFLFLTDTPLGMIDCYVANPDLSKELRDTCLNAVTEDLIERAKELKLKVLMCSSNISAIKKRAELHGFKYKSESSLYTREI